MGSGPVDCGGRRLGGGDCFTVAEVLVPGQVCAQGVGEFAAGWRLPALLGGGFHRGFGVGDQKQFGASLIGMFGEPAQLLGL